MTVKKPKAHLTPFKRAQGGERYLRLWTLLVMLLYLVVVLISGTHVLPLGPAEEVGLLGLIFAVPLMVYALATISMAVLQMEQAEEHRSTDRELADAMRDLANELRRRPEVSSSVTLALFAAPPSRTHTGSVEGAAHGQ